MLPEYDNIKTQVAIICSSERFEKERIRIIEQIERAEIKAAYFDLYEARGYGSSEEVMQHLADHFNKSVKTISNYVYH